MLFSVCEAIPPRQWALASKLSGEPKLVILADKYWLNLV